MKRLILISLALFLLFEIGNGQCKLNKGKYSSKRFTKSDSKPFQIVLHSIPSRLFLQGNGYSYYFCKSSEDSIYLGLGIGTNWEKFEIHKTNPVIFKFDDEAIMTIYPNGNYTGKMRPTSFSILAYYNINIEQLNEFANKLITNVQIYIFDDDKKNTKISWNDDGTVYYNLDKLKTKKTAKFKKVARCMLNQK